MPVLRNVRRSRPVSHPPLSEAECDAHDLQLQYPPSPGDHTPSPSLPSSSSSSSSSPTSPPHPRTPSPVARCPSRHSEASDYAPAPEIVSRASHARKKKPGHIPRPPNAFLMFRSDVWSKEKMKPAAERDHREISRIAGALWKELSEHEQSPYKAKADAAKEAHALQYPNYKYAPVSKKDKPTKKKGKVEDAVSALRKAVAQPVGRGAMGAALEKDVKRMDEDEPEDDEDDEDDEDYDPSLHHSRRRPRRTQPSTPAAESPAPPSTATRHAKRRFRPQRAATSSSKGKSKAASPAHVKLEEAVETIPSRSPSPIDVDPPAAPHPVAVASPSTSPVFVVADYIRQHVKQTPRFSFADDDEEVPFASVPTTLSADRDIPREHLEWPVVSSYDPTFVDSVYSGLKPSAIRALMEAEDLGLSPTAFSTNFLTSDFSDMSINDMPSISPDEAFVPGLFAAGPSTFSGSPSGLAEVWEPKSWFEL